MGKADFLRVGDYNAICDSCGQKFKFSQLKLRWDGLYCCTVNRCWEIRQPQDYVRGVLDRQAVPISRPDAPPVYIQDETVTETPIISLLSIIIRNRFGNPKLINGATLNTATIG